MSKFVLIAVRDEGQAKLFKIEGHGMSIDSIRSYVKEALPNAHPILIGVDGGRSTPAQNDNDTEPSLA